MARILLLLLSNVSDLNVYFIHSRRTPITELVHYTPKEMAIATVNGILTNQQYVELPWCMKGAITLLQ